MFEPTTSGLLPLAQAVNAIADTLDPEDNRRSRARFRIRIERAESAGHIRFIFLNNQKYLDIEHFVPWALRTLPELSKFLLPLPAQMSGQCEINLSGISTTGELHSLPNTVGPLQQLCARLISDNNTLRSEKEMVNEQLIDIQTEREASNAKAALRSQRASDAGKKGGRGNTI